MHFGRIFFVLCALTSFSFAGAGADYMRGVGKRAIDTLVNANKSASSTEKEFQGIFLDSFDEEALLKFFIGQEAYNGMNAEQKKKYKNIVVKRLSKSYANKFKEYKGLTFDVKDNETSSVDPSFGAITKVESTLTAPDKPTVEVTWYLVNSGGYQIVDVYVHAADTKFSMALTNRPQYQSAWNNAQGNVDAFLDAIAPK